MTLNDLWAIFKVTESLNAAKMTKYSLVMTPTPCRAAGGNISIRPTFSCARALTYLLTYTELPVSLATSPQASRQRTVSIVLYCGIARFALLLHATCRCWTRTAGWIYIANSSLLRSQRRFHGVSTLIQGGLWSLLAGDPTSVAAAVRHDAIFVTCNRWAGSVHFSSQVGRLGGHL